jgi:hypothetical protein
MLGSSSLEALMQDVFDQLRELMLRGAPQMAVARDEPGLLELQASWDHPKHPGMRVQFGKVQLGRAYVGFHLMPLYMNTRLDDLLDETLARRRHGKTCFNFKSADPEAFEALETLTRACAKAFEQRPAF